MKVFIIKNDPNFSCNLVLFSVDDLKDWIDSVASIMEE